MNLNHTIKDTIFDILVDKISSGYYEDGQQLVELELANEFNVSRSPVREAIKQLVAYDLATSIPHKGIFVKKLGDKKMKEIYELRILLENYCLSKIKGKLSKDILDELEFIKNIISINNKNKSNKDYIEADEKLHNLIITFGENDTLIEIYYRNISLVRTFRGASLTDEVRFEESIDEHLSLIDAIIEGDYNRASYINTTHLSKALDTILENN